MSRPDVPAGQFRFKDLCLDAVDAGRAAEFWSGVLGLPAQERGTSFRLADDVPEHTLWINAVPEPRTVKQRVHLDVHTGAVSDLLQLGAAVVEEEERWTVLADPEGGELCAFVRPPDRLPGYRLYELVVDAADPDRIATWWAQRFGVAVQHADGESFCWLEGVPGMPWEMVFQPVPEPKRVKNRVHWDLWGRTEDACDAGARLVRAQDDEISWDVLADPEGNEFCVFDPS